MRIVYLLLVASLFHLCPDLIAQPCPPVGFPDAGNTCVLAPVLCANIDDYCNTINNNNVQQTFPGCGGFVLNNDEWFAFVAGTTTITIQVTPSNCTSNGNNQGMQAGIYRQCVSMPVALQCPCTTNPFILTSTTFVVGATYYFVLDGCGGDVCDYKIDVLAGSTVPPPPANANPVTGPIKVCAGSTSVYSTTPASGASIYPWTLTPPGAGTLASGTGTSKSITWGNTPGIATVCVSTANSCQANPNQACLDVEIIPKPTATISGAGVLCQGSSTPIGLTVTFTGEGPWTFTYTRNGVAQPPITTSTNPYTLNVTQVGNYVLTGVSTSAASNCNGTVSGSAAITQSNMTPTTSTTAANCGLPNGGVNLTVGGTGTPPYMFSWSNGATTEDLANVVGNTTYTVTVTDANGCTKTATATVANNTINFNVTGTTTANTTCDGNNNGSINISVNPGGSYTYEWSNGATTEDLANVPSGTYTVTVSAGGTCTKVNSFTVADQPNQPSLSSTSVNTTCDLLNGSINLTASGGVMPYTFSWSNGETTEDLNNILAGTYTVTVTGANGCTKTLSATITNSNPTFTVNSTIVANTNCDGTGNGSITQTVTPAGSYTFEWDNASTTQNQTGLLPGTYVVTVSAGGSCTVVKTYTVPDNPNKPNLSATTVSSTCNLPNGSINLSVSGGVPSYTFLWPGGETTEDLSNVLAGSYAVTVTGANGCTQELNVTVNNNDPTFTVNSNIVANTNCDGTGNGSITQTVAPAGSYTFEWDNGSTAQNQTGLLPGTYVVTVSAGGSCTTVKTYTVPDNPNQPNLSATNVNTTCDLSNGSINLSVSGGVPPYTFAWDNGATTEDLSSIMAGNYSVTVTGANGCTRELSVAVANNNPTFTINPTIVASTTCNGNGNGSISLSVTPGGSYTFMWDNGASTPSITNLLPGTYVVTVSAGGSCTQEQSYTVPDLPNLPNLNATTIASTCDLPNGSINLSVSGGVPPYTFLWSNNSSSQNLTGLLAGSYQVTVTGANGCTRELDVTVNNNNPTFNINANIQPSTTCNGNGNGSISITVSPGGSYTFMWNTGSSSPNLTNLLPGSYTVTVSAGGSCTNEQTFEVPENPNLPNLSATNISSTCDLPNGSINLSVSGGVPPYTYLWSNNATVQDINNLLAGSYTVTVTGANGCTRELEVTVDNNNPTFNINANIQPSTTCNGNGNGSISITVSPGGSYTFMWNTGSSSQNLINLLPGTYTVTVSAGGSCTDEQTFEVPENPNLPNLTYTTVTATCDLPNGSINLSVSGGVPPYTYLWSNNATTQDINNLLAGNYEVTVTGANGCTQIANVTIDNNNPSFNINGTVQSNTTCNPVGNGSISVTISPGGSYTFSWSTGATSQNLTNLLPGTYTITVSAGGSCIQSEEFTVFDSPNEPQLSFSAVDAKCGLNNGSINLTVTGGTTPYIYAWSSGQTIQDPANIPAGTYEVTVTGSNGCSAVGSVDVDDVPIQITNFEDLTSNTSCLPPGNGKIVLNITPANTTVSWSNGLNTKTISNLPAGQYIATVSAGGTCVEIYSYTIEDETSLPELSPEVTEANCGLATGSIQLDVANGALPYKFKWSNSATTQNLTKLVGGTYTVTVTTALGCTAVAAVVVPDNPLGINLFGTVEPNTSCANPDGSIYLDVDPTGFAYKYKWSNGATTKDVLNLPAGIYTVTVTVGTCSASEPFEVINNAVAPNLAASGTPTTCGQSNGSATANASGGIPPYKYKWNTTATTQTITNLLAGTYTVTVTGANGCAATATAVISNNNTPVSITSVVTENTSCTVGNGAINITTAPAGTYKYKWSNGQTTEDVSGLGTGVYTVTATLGATCTATASYTVVQNTSDPQISPNITSSICGASNGAINLSISGGIAPYKFVWSSADTTEDLSNVLAGNYSVTVTATNGCTADTTLNVPNNSNTFTLVGAALPLSNCATANGAVNITVTPLIVPPGTFSFAWSNNTNAEDLANLPAGTYTVTVSEVGSACTASASYIVEDVTTFPNASQNLKPEICGLANGSIDVSVTDGATPYTFLWSSGQKTEDLTNISAGTYTLTVTGTNGCTGTVSADVPDNSIPFSLSGNTSANTACAPNNGGINLDVSPAGAYTFIWSNGVKTEDLAAIPGGAYSVTVSAGGTCTNVATFNVDDNTDAPILSKNVVAASCAKNNGSINLTVTGSTTPYTFKWSSGEITEDLANIPSGDYIVTVTGGNGCVTVDNLTVPENVIFPSISGTPSANTACGTDNGSISLNITPAVGPYTFAWASGQTTQNLVNIAPGTYTITVSGGGACTATSTFEVLNNTDAPIISPQITPSICSHPDGSITLGLSGSTTPYQFKWSNGLTVKDLTGLVPGTYTVTVTGANGCSTTSSLAVVEQVVLPQISGTLAPNTACATPTGSIMVNVTPFGSYTFKWSNGPTTQNLTGLLAGSYTVTVSGGGTCVSTSTFDVVNQTDSPVITPVINPSLCSHPDGAIDISIVGGTTPYVFQWSNGKSSEDLTGLVPGTYTVTVTAANGCSAASSNTVVEQVVLPQISGVLAPNTACTTPTGSITLDVTPIGTYTFKWSNGATTQDLAGLLAGIYTVTVNGGGTCISESPFALINQTDSPVITPNIKPSLCSQPDGAIDISIVGGTEPYVFTWSNGKTSEDLVGILSGPYAVTVTASNGCTATATMDVPNNSNSFSISAALTPNTACGAGNGSINVTMAPTDAYVFAWSNNKATEDLANLLPGTYTVTVTDPGKCVASSTFVILEEAKPVSTSGVPTNILCFGDKTGAIDLSVAVGTAPFTYQWSPAQPGNPQDLNNIGAGNYAVTVTDVLGCSGTAAFSLTQPGGALSLSCAMTKVVSQPGQTDGEAAVTITGGTAPFAVTLSPGGFSQNGVAAGVLPFNNLGVGSYITSVTDANGCTSVCNFNVGLVKCETVVGTMSGATLSRCGLGCITATYNSAGQFLQPDDILQFVLHTGNSNSIVGEIARNSQPVFCFDAAKMTYGTTYRISAVAGNNDGSGNVVLSDYCTVVSLGAPVVFNEKPEAAIAPPKSISCAFLQVDLVGSSTIANSIFDWKTINGQIIGSTSQPTVKAGKKGLYTLIVNANTCADTALVQVQDITNDPKASVGADPADVLDCKISKIVLSGTIEGSTNANAIWMSNGVVYSTQNPVPITQPGTYEFIILDTLTRCSDTAKIVINENLAYPLLFVNPTGPLTCKNPSVTLSGGSPLTGILFKWGKLNGPDTTLVGVGSSVTVNTPGTYVLIGVDPSNQCKNSSPLVVLSDQVYPIAEAGAGFTVKCYGELAQLDGSASTGLPGLTFLWTTQDGNLSANIQTATPTITEPGTYALLVTNPNGCTDTDNVVIAPEVPVPNVKIKQPRCYGDKGSFTITDVVGGKPPFRYSLDNGATFTGSNQFVGLTPGTYGIYIIDAEGCFATTSVTLIQPAFFDIKVIPDIVQVKLGDTYTIIPTVSVPDSAIGSIQWLPGKDLDCDTCLTPTFKAINTTYFKVVAADKGGCVDEALFRIYVDKEPHVYIPNIFSPNGDGENDVFMIFGDLKQVVKIRSFQIFSRWGEMVFEQYNFPPNNPPSGWDGRHRGQDLNPAVFVWYAEIEFLDGNVVLYKGDVTLER